MEGTLPVTVRVILAIVLSFALSRPSVFGQEIPLSEYQSRRVAISQRLDDGLILLFGNEENEGSEAYHVFEQEKNFRYLSGYVEPGAAMLLAPQPPDHSGSVWEEVARLPREILFLPSRNAEQERWTGPRLDPTDNATAVTTGFSAVKPIDQLAREIRRYSDVYSVIYVLLPNYHGGIAPASNKALDRLKTLLPFATFRDATRTLGALRQAKSENERKLIDHAIACTTKGLEAAAAELQPGIFEYELGAILKYKAERDGCRQLSFDPIIGSGVRSTIIHYTKNSERVQDGELVVMDVGAEFEGYAADITRTVPVNGKFTARQREIYEIVLGAQNAALRALKPGMKFTGRGSDSIYQIAYDYINTHGKDRHGQSLGRYFTHGLSHHVGLDVHDAGDVTRPLEPGMVITVEPGIYLPEEKIGIRIEDMVLVTKDGYSLLTGKLPRNADEIENWLKK